MGAAGTAHQWLTWRAEQQNVSACAEAVKHRMSGMLTRMSFSLVSTLEALNWSAKSDSKRHGLTWTLSMTHGAAGLRNCLVLDAQRSMS